MTGGGVTESSTPVPGGAKLNQRKAKMTANRAIANQVCFRTGILVWILVVASGGAAQTQSPDVAATELVRRTLARELAAADLCGPHICRVHEETSQGSETRVLVETRDLQVGRLILKNGRPLPPALGQREEERLRALLTNRARLRKLQAEQRSDEARVHRILQVLPEAWIYQHAGAEKDSAGRDLALVTFRPNPDFRPRTTELRVLQGVEGTILIDSAAERFVRVTARLCRDVDFGWGIVDHLTRGGSIVLEQQAVWHDEWAITTLSLHYTNRLLLMITSRGDSVTRVSDYRRLPDDLTQQQALELLLEQDRLTSAALGSGKTP